MINSDKNFHILIADDEPRNLQLLMSILSEVNYQIYVASNGSMALKKAKSIIPDLILMDINMPQMDGFEACKQLKSSQSTAGIPVIFLTARTETDDIVKGFELGAVDYIVKPFNSHELLSRVNTHVELRRKEQQILQSYQVIKDQKEQILNDKKKIEQKELEMKELVHVLCHDLLNPIGSIQSLLGIISDEPESFSEYFHSIEFLTHTATDIIALVRDYLALESGKKRLVLEAFNLCDLINRSAEILKHKLNEKNIKLLIDVAPEINVMVEKVSFINSVLNNLFTNAIKFSETNSKIMVSATKYQNEVVLNIKDNGIGMPEEILNNIFSINKCTTRKGTNGEIGTGFGMPLVLKYILSYSGEIKINSKVRNRPNDECGTDIKITLKAT